MSSQSTEAQRPARDGGRGELPVDGERRVARPRLTEALLARPLAVVEAGAGYGKTVLAGQLRESCGLATAYVPLGPADHDRGVLIGSIRRALAAARLSDLLAAAEGGEPEAWIERLLDGLAGGSEGVLLVLDDVHHLQHGDGRELVIRLARGVTAPNRLLVLGRSFADGLEALWHSAEAVRLDTEALAFTLPETAELLRARSGSELSDHDVRIALEATRGWATALVLAAARPESSESARPAADGADPVAGPLRGILHSMRPGQRSAVVQLAHLPVLSPELCAEVSGGEGMFGLMVSAGVPLARTESGWWELPAPVAVRLAARSPLRPEVARVAARVYSAEGEELRALRLLMNAGLPDDAARRLAELTPAEADRLTMGVVRELVDSLPSAVLARHPRGLLHLARLAETAQQRRVRAQALERARTVANADPELARELEAEHARDLMWDERTRGEARESAERVLAAAGPGEVIARARALDVLGRLASWFSPTGPEPVAEPLLRESARLARGLGQPTWTAQALVALGAGFLFALCRYDEALEVLDEALGELPARNRYRAMVQSFRADCLVELARFQEADAALAQMREIGHAVGERWILGYAAWLEAAVASYQGDRERTVRAYREIDRQRDAWFDEPAGGECLAQVADHLSRAGDDALALECLERARAKMTGNERIVRVHGAAVLARSGPVQDAERAIEEALEHRAAEPHELWPLRLQRAYVAQRAGRPGAAQLAAEAFEACDALGLSRGPLIREPVLGPALLGLAVAAGSPAAARLADRATNPGWSLRLLGGFELTRTGDRSGGADEVPLTGYPARAVRVVASHGGQIHGERLIEWMWPNADPARTGNRLRNLLSRVRRAAGEVLERDGAMVRLSARCEVDADRFEAGARHALAVAVRDRRQAGTLARMALDAYRGELLPEDRFAEWAQGPRERLRSLATGLFDLLVDEAEATGELDEAIRVLQRAVDADPEDEAHHLRLVRLLVLQGRTGAARAALRRAGGILEATGLTASGERLALERDLFGVGEQ